MTNPAGDPIPPSPEPSAKRLRSPQVRVILSVAALLLGAVIAETGLLVAGSIADRNTENPDGQSQGAWAVSEPGNPETKQPSSPEPAMGEGRMKWGEDFVEVIHPFLGYVQDPKHSTDTSYLGFPREGDDPFSKSGDATLTIAFMGASFAEGVATTGKERLLATLQERGIEARVINLAMGGYKQPQQLMALTYLLSEQPNIDVVVNIDGFTEVTLPVTDNLPYGVNPFYPRAWNFRTRGLATPEDLGRIGEIRILRRRKQNAAAFFEQVPKLSVTRKLIWPAYDRHLDERIRNLEALMKQEAAGREAGFLQTGPLFRAEGEAEVYDQLVRQWATCSRLMHDLCEARGIKYLHVLHPNQYDETGRTLTEEERRIAFREDQPYRPGVVEGYPRLREAGAELRAEGIDFHDFTMIFKAVPETVYHDDCCHPNGLGYEIIAEGIANAIADALSP